MHAVTGVGYAPAGEVADPAPVRELLRAGGAVQQRPAGAARRGAARWRVLGDTTEGALLVAAAKAGLDLAAEEAAAPRVGRVPLRLRTAS